MSETNPDSLRTALAPRTVVADLIRALNDAAPIVEVPGDMIRPRRNDTIRLRQNDTIRLRQNDNLGVVFENAVLPAVAPAGFAGALP